jgi:hypothetical protein
MKSTCKTIFNTKVDEQYFDTVFPGTLKQEHVESQYDKFVKICILPLK